MSLNMVSNINNVIITKRGKNVKFNKDKNR